MQQISIFTIFSTQATRNEKIMIISICFLYASFSPAILGLPLWFQSPTLLCSQINTNEFPNTINNQFYCTEEEMCTNNLLFQIDWSISPSTLLTQLSLFCERTLIKRLILSMIFFGGFAGCFVNFLIYVNPEKRLKVFASLGLLFGFFNYVILFFSHSEFVVGISLSFMSFTYLMNSAYVFIMVNEYFSGDLAKAATILIKLSCAFFGIIFAFFAYLINSDWRVLFFTNGTLVLLGSSFLLFFKSQKGIKETLSKAVCMYIYINIRYLLKFLCYFYIFILTSRRISSNF